MSQDDSLEEQIRQFYDKVPEVHDALPMKDYLLKHENNQMAWYLLGKQYAARGEHGKANYCFAQAGPVYEAFESRTSPVLAEPGGTDARPSRRRARRWAAAAAALLALALGLLLPGGQAGAPGVLRSRLRRRRAKGRRRPRQPPPPATVRSRALSRLKPRRP